MVGGVQERVSTSNSMPADARRCPRPRDLVRLLFHACSCCFSVPLLPFLSSLSSPSPSSLSPFLSRSLVFEFSHGLRDLQSLYQRTSSRRKASSWCQPSPWLSP